MAKINPKRDSISAAVVRTYLGLVGTEDLRIVIEKKLGQGTNLFEELEDNGLLCLGYAILSKGDLRNSLPGDVFLNLRTRALSLIARKQMQVSAIKKTGEIFEKENIKAVLTGGFGRLHDIYPDDSIRYSSDIDMLISASSSEKAVAILSDAGFDCKFHNKGITAKKSEIIFDIGFKPSDLLTITSIPEEAEIFSGLDNCWLERVEKSKFPFFFNFEQKFELLLEILHFSYKHQFEKMSWALDILLLFKGLSDNDLRILEQTIKRENLTVHVRYVFIYLLDVFGIRGNSRAVGFLEKVNYNCGYLVLPFIYKGSISASYKRWLCYPTAFFSAKNKKLKVKMLKNFIKSKIHS